MTTLVLLVLAAVWGVVLFSWLRSRARATFGDPVGNFRRHLTVLEHTSPVTVRPANTLRITLPTGRSVAAQPSWVGASPGPGGVARSPEVRSVGTGVRPAAPYGRPRSSSAAAMRRRQTLKRRRDILLALVTAAVGSLLLGLVPGLHAMLLVQLVVDILLAAYVSLLIRLRNLALERDRKLAYLPRAQRPDLAAAAYARSTTRATPGRAAQEAGRRRVGGLERYGTEVAFRRVALP